MDLSDIQMAKISPLAKCFAFRSSQDSSVGRRLDWYLEGPGFKSGHLQLNRERLQDSRFYAIRHIKLSLALMKWEE